jgi:hypothetical protein
LRKAFCRVRLPAPPPLFDEIPFRNAFHVLEFAFLLLRGMHFSEGDGFAGRNGRVGAGLGHAFSASGLRSARSKFGGETEFRFSGNEGQSDGQESWRGWALMCSATSKLAAPAPIARILPNGIRQDFRRICPDMDQKGYPCFLPVFGCTGACLQFSHKRVQNVSSYGGMCARHFFYKRTGFV